MTTPTRLAIVGSSSVLGGDLKDLLARTGYAGNTVELLDLEEQVGLVTQYGDEARVILEAAEESLREHQLVCFCGDPADAQRFAPVIVDAGGTVIDCSAAHGLAADFTLIDRAGSHDADGLLVVPHAGTLLLAELGAALGGRLGDSVATLLLPASELADAATAELWSQATAMLNFGDCPEEVFGRRLAFDVWTDATPPDGAANTILAQLDTLGVEAPALSALRASVFHATSASIYLRGTSADALREALQRAGIPIDAPNAESAVIDSPTRVAGHSVLHAGDIREDASGSWLWALLDNHQAVAATVLDAVKSRLPLPEPPTD